MKFSDQNINVLLNKNLKTISEACEDLKKKVIARGRVSPHNVFIYFSGHAILDSNGLLQAAIKGQENSEPDLLPIDKFVNEISKRVNCHVIALIDTSKKKPATKGLNNDRDKRQVKKERLTGGMVPLVFGVVLEVVLVVPPPGVP